MTHTLRIGTVGVGVIGLSGEQKPSPDVMIDYAIRPGDPTRAGIHGGIRRRPKGDDRNGW
ncbi:hypothetical protein HCB18_27355 [Salinispora arenicola]|uniref:hypothetical protein n=1 Tax=Salinispora arenicola TaxID=168697 RepID=UPI001690513F|nr:hypothetical protein [Salinispora arenicola]NIL60043.1 hypothetical protein [Salinispora arenicola]